MSREAGHAETFYVYLLASGPFGWLYVGVTNDLVRRVAEHKQGLVPGYTAEHGIDQLVWYESHAYINNAILREKRIKRWRREWKFALVEQDNPRWLDLYGELRARQPGPGSAEPTGPVG
ncbi:GIY-YIG nuclease family protein [Brevundimonas sp.]|uniref:GIY-YIG nuclease family protein n=1 Tax=Brevundimonas sp. TaxID=1871086 RepID=UPI003BAD432D